MSASADGPMFEVIAEAVQRFNRMHTDGPIAHRERMELIMHTPALRANATIRHADWLTGSTHVTPAAAHRVCRPRISVRSSPRRSRSALRKRPTRSGSATNRVISWS